MAVYDDMTPREREIFGTLDLAAQAHPVVIDEGGVARFEANPLLRALVDAGLLSLDAVWQAAASSPRIRPHDLLRFYRDIGYSVGGYDEILGSHLDYFSPALESP